MWVSSIFRKWCLVLVPRCGHLHINTTIHILLFIRHLSSYFYERPANAQVCGATKLPWPKNQRVWTTAKCLTTSPSSSPVLFMVRSSICSPPWHPPQFGLCWATRSCCSISGACDSLVPLRTHNLLRIVVRHEHTGEESKLAKLRHAFNSVPVLTGLLKTLPVAQDRIENNCLLLFKNNLQRQSVFEPLWLFLHLLLKLAVIPILDVVEIKCG